jgi:hypothetical protein
MTSVINVVNSAIKTCDGVLLPSELEVLANKYNSFNYGWKANVDHSYDQGHWNLLVIGPTKYEEEKNDLQYDKQFISSNLNSVWNKMKMVYGERSMLRCYFNAYTYGTEGYIHVDVSDKNLASYKKQGLIAETVLLFCNDEWETDWAGETIFFDRKEIAYATLPYTNRSVCFDASVPHVARSPSRACHKLRKILAFKTLRKEIDEDACVQFIRETMQNVAHSKTTFAEHLIGTYDILKNLNMPVDVCVAALFHAIYGTEFFSHNSNVERKLVKSLIGDYAEDLAHTFSSMKNRIHTITTNEANYNEVKLYHLACIEYANLLEQLPRINVSGVEQMKAVVDKIIKV